MSWFRLSCQFSGAPLSQSVERRFGLQGFARLVKLLELLAASDPATGGVVSLAKSDWFDHLQASPDELHELLNYLAKAGWLTYAEGGEPGSPLSIDFLKADDFLPSPAPILFTDAAQWVFWCETELNMPRAVSSDPYSQALFRRWCASNVTVTEMQLACEAAIKGQPDLSPTALHRHLQAVRSARLEQAKA